MIKYTSSYNASGTFGFFTSQWLLWGCAGAFFRFVHVSNIINCRVVKIATNVHNHFMWILLDSTGRLRKLHNSYYNGNKIHFLGNDFYSMKNIKSLVKIRFTFILISPVNKSIKHTMTKHFVEFRPKSFKKKPTEALSVAINTNQWCYLLYILSNSLTVEVVSFILMIFIGFPLLNTISIEPTQNLNFPTITNCSI